MMMTYETAGTKEKKMFEESSNISKWRRKENPTWSRSVTAFIPMNRWLFKIPSKIFSSSGFRELTSLKICSSNKLGNYHALSCMNGWWPVHIDQNEMRTVLEELNLLDRERMHWISRYSSLCLHAEGFHVPNLVNSFLEN
jgi:hypothetical protein